MIRVCCAKQQRHVSALAIRQNRRAHDTRSLRHLKARIIDPKDLPGRAWILPVVTAGRRPRSSTHDGGPRGQGRSVRELRTLGDGRITAKARRAVVFTPDDNARLESRRVDVAATYLITATGITGCCEVLYFAERFALHGCFEVVPDVEHTVHAASLLHDCSGDALLQAPRAEPWLTRLCRLWVGSSSAIGGKRPPTQPVGYTTDSPITSAAIRSSKTSTR